MKMCTWKEAFNFIEELNKENYLGYSDWRLPNIDELSSLIKIQSDSPFINEKKYGYYWSSTTHAYDSHYAWVVHFNLGYVNYNHKLYSYYVRCVRGGQVDSLTIRTLKENEERFDISDPKLVVDNKTQLIWIRDLSFPKEEPKKLYCGYCGHKL